MDSFTSDRTDGAKIPTSLLRDDVECCVLLHYACRTGLDFNPEHEENQVAVIQSYVDASPGLEIVAVAFQLTK